MAFHIVLNRPSNLEQIYAESHAGLRPRHSMAELALGLGATVHDGTGVAPNRIEQMLGKVTGMNPLWWAIARRLRQTMQGGDVIFCTGEDVGIPVAYLCGKVGRVTMTVHAADSWKKRLAFALLRVKERTARFFVVAQPQARSLRDDYGVPDAKVQFVWDQTDTAFFSPGPAEDMARPLVVSIGLERRDYTTLALATADMPVDVRISGFSSDTRVMSQAFPAELPANMRRDFYPWSSMAQLYRNADVVVVSLFPNGYAAGVQGLMEALSSGRPVVATRTQGLEAYLAGGVVRVVPPQDPAAMAEAIAGLLSDGPERERISAKGRALAQDRHTLERYLKTLGDALRALAA